MQPTEYEEGVYILVCVPTNAEDGDPSVIYVGMSDSERGIISRIKNHLSQTVRESESDKMVYRYVDDANNPLEIFPIVVAKSTRQYGRFFWFLVRTFTLLIWDETPS